MSAQRRLAVVLGVGAYTALPPLPQCEAGAEDVASALAARGYDVTTVVNGDRRRVQASFRDVVSAAGRAGGATLVAYIAAHGVSCCGENYIVPLDGVADTDMGAFRALGVGGQWMRERGGACTGRCTCSNAPLPPLPRAYRLCRRCYMPLQHVAECYRVWRRWGCVVVWGCEPGAVPWVLCCLDVFLAANAACWQTSKTRACA